MASPVCFSSAKAQPNISPSSSGHQDIQTLLTLKRGWKECEVDLTANPVIQERAWIVTGLRSRDRSFFEDLVRHHHGRVFHYLLARTGSWDQAEDLSQETWVRVLERGSQYRGNCAFESWLLAVARNLAIDAARKARFLLGPPLDMTADTSQTPTSETPSPFDLACRRETTGRMRDAARELSPRLRSVWRLRFEDSLSLAAIAARLNLAPGTVRSRLHRGIAAVRARVEPAAQN
jgi:RNA polymerase sigma-70 factor (ECF subfamily)